MSNISPCSAAVICHFASDSLVRVFSDLIKTKGVVWELLTSWINPKTKEEKSCEPSEIEEVLRRTDIIPFVLCESRSVLKQFGVKCPYEFIIEQKDLLYTDDGDGFDAILRRAWTISKNVGAPGFKALQDWFAGTFRRYLYLDESVHGTSGHIDLTKVRGKKVSISDVNMKNNLVRRFGTVPEKDENVPDAMLRLRTLLEALFDGYTFKDGQPIKYFGDAIRSNFEGWVKDAYDGGEHKNIPFARGDRIRYITPTGSLNVLYIDDNANNVVGSSDGRSRTKDCLSSEEVKKRLEELDKIRKDNSLSLTDPRRVSARKEYDSLFNLSQGQGIKNDQDEVFDSSAFNVQPLQIKSSEADMVGTVRERLQKTVSWGLSFDFVLLDLNLGDSVGRDPSGYHLIKVVRQVLPHVPIVVYSNYDDMGHITRALQCGARWYLRKGNEEKMKRHILQLLKKASWREEWRSMQDYASVQFVYSGDKPMFDDQFKHLAEWQYLTAKSLEYYPGKFIAVSQMGGGLSAAVTFKAQKGLSLNGKPLQSPVIIKIDSASNTRMEFERYFRMVRPYMANEAGRVENPSIILNRDCSAIVYTFTGRNDKDHELSSVKSLLEKAIQFKASCDYSKFEKMLDDLFDNILPKIHKVTPDREFGGGGNRHVEVFSHPSALDAKESPEAAFPNAAFDEVPKTEFWRSYMMRFPVYRKYSLTDEAVFEQQPVVSDWEKLPCADNRYHFTYHGDILCDGQYEIEALDDDGRPIILSGRIVDHVAKYRRRMYPGMALWLRKEYVQEQKTLDALGCFKLFLADVKKSAEEDGRCFDDQILGKDGTEYISAIEKIVALCRKLNSHECEAASDADKIEDALIRSKCHLFTWPVAICHGDLNYGNIMVENCAGKITDVWLIDFARTRRDLIAHDFNVMFTSTLALLFKRELMESDAKRANGERGYEEALNSIMPRFIYDVMFAANDVPPDYIDSDLRFSFVYKILRRIRRAALTAGVSLHSYALTTALESLLAARLYLRHGANMNAAKAFVDVANCCYDWLASELQLTLLKRCPSNATTKQMSAKTQTATGAKLRKKSKNSKFVKGREAKKKTP